MCFAILWYGIPFFLKGFASGVDMDMQANLYAAELPGLVRAGKVNEQAINASVRRILRAKFELGLFENPYVNADAEAAARRLAADAGARRNAPPPPDAPRETIEQGGFIPTLRAVEPGESRVLGTFSTVDCLRGAIVLQVDAASGPVRLAIKGFDEVEFLSYRQDTPTNVGCGLIRPAQRAHHTLDAASFVDHRQLRHEKPVRHALLVPPQLDALD